MSKITVVGFGSWGTALAVLLSGNGHEVTVTARNAAQLAEAAAEKENKKYLPGVPLPEALRFEADLEKALEGAEMVLFAVPSQHFRANLKKALPYLPEDAVLVNVAKGIEQKTLKRQSEIAAEVAPAFRYVALSGPSHAEEVGRHLPTTVSSASEDREAAELVQRTFMNDRFRVYTNTDLVGVELGGALKNIMALGAGVSDGLGYGDNAKAALMTRGITEMTRLGVALGAEPETFAGLSGIGDLIVTCTSMHSRNRRCGILIGQGVPPEEAVSRIGMVVEGITTCYAACELAEKAGVEMPITQCIRACLEGELTPLEAIDLLMTRRPKYEN